MKTKKRFAVAMLAMLMVLMFVFSACGAPKAEAPVSDEKTETKAPVTESSEPVTLVYQGYGTNDMFKLMFDKYIEATGANVELEVWAVGQENIMSSLIAQMESGDMADVSWWGGANWLQYKDNGALLEVNDLIEEHFGGTDHFSDTTFAAITDENGKIWGFPCEMQIQGWVYNKAVFEKYGLEIPETTDELIECAKVFSENGVTTIATGEGDFAWGWNFWTNLYGLDEEYLNVFGPKANKSILDTELPKQLDVLVDLQEAGAFDPNNSTVDIEMMKVLVSEGKAAMMNCSADYTFGLVGSEADLNGDLVYSTGPKMSDSSYNQEKIIRTCGNYYGVRADIEDEKLAALMDFFKWAYSEEGANAILSEGYVLPVNGVEFTAEVSPLVKSIAELTIECPYESVVSRGALQMEAYNNQSDVFLAWDTVFHGLGTAIRTNAMHRDDLEDAYKQLEEATIKANNDYNEFYGE